MRNSFVEVGEEVPQWRDFHSATNLKNRMYVFGGRFDRIGPLQTPQNIYDDRLYVFDPLNQSWALINSRGQAPCGRRSHSACPSLLFSPHCEERTVSLVFSCSRGEVVYLRWFQ